MSSQKLNPEGNNDPLPDEQVKQTVVRHNEDLISILLHMQGKYESPESAIEDYRKGYISEEYLVIRFTPEEVEFIHEESKERDEAAASNVGGYL